MLGAQHHGNWENYNVKSDIFGIENQPRAIPVKPAVKTLGYQKYSLPKLC